MKTKPSSSGGNSSKSTHSKKTAGNSRERDKKKQVASESGGSSQCETPPLTDKDASSLGGKYAGISPDSVNCMAEQIGVEITNEAISNLAEDVSFKLRQVIHNISLYSQHSNKSRIQVGDVNAVLKLMDTGPVIGAGYPHWISFGDENLCCEQETIVDTFELALTPQKYNYITLPTLSVNWVTDEKSLPTPDCRFSTTLQIYYTKVSKAILNGSKKHKQVALNDLSSNQKFGATIEHYFNLAVLILNDDNLNALNIIHKVPLQTRILEMIEAICLNPCSSDTNVNHQLQRLFPVMVSNILGNGQLAHKMLSALYKITGTWPLFRPIGKSILNEYLSQNIKERLSHSMIDCLCTLGRQSIIDCLSVHLDYVDERMASDPPLRAAILDASTLLMRPEPTTHMEDYIATDSTLYEMLGDSLLPRRIVIQCNEKIKEDVTRRNESSENSFYMPYRSRISRIRLKFMLPRQKTQLPQRHCDFFEQTKFRSEVLNSCFKFHVNGCIQVSKKPSRIALTHIQSNTITYNNYINNYPSSSTAIVITKGALNRFRYKMPVTTSFTMFENYLL